jgi:hypothetical protein
LFLNQSKLRSDRTNSAKDSLSKGRIPPMVGREGGKEREGGREGERQTEKRRRRRRKGRKGKRRRRRKRRKFDFF